MVLSSQTAVPAFDFRLEEDFWPILPAAFGRHRLYSDYQSLLAIPVSVWPDQPGYRRMRKGFVKMYRDFCSQRGRKECRGLLARMFKGYTEDEAVSYAKDVVSDELQRPMGVVFLEDRGSDPSPERIRTGLRPIPEMEDLLRVFGKEGFDVWVVSEDPQVAVRQLVKQFGLPPEHGLGIKVAVSSATFLMSDEVEHPFPFRSGKVEAVIAAVGKAPAVVVARDAEDTALLSFGEGLRLLIDGGDETLRRVGVDRGWVIQPAFPP
jgi:phosphoserine phosphatase